MHLLLAQLQIEYPARLVWLGLLPLLAYFAWRSRTAASFRRRLAALVCRVLIVTALVAALAGISWRGSSSERMLVLAVDSSRSVQGAGSKAAAEFVTAVESSRGVHAVRVLEFAGQPNALPRGSMPREPSPDAMASDPAAAVQAVAASIPHDYVPQIALLSDGNQTRGDLARAAVGLGMPIDVIPLPAFSEPEVCVAEISAGEPDSMTGDVRLEIAFRSNRAGSANLQILRDEQLAVQRDVELIRGESRIAVDLPLGDGESSLFDARIAAADDTIAENNRRRTRVFHPPPPRILLVAPEPQQGERLQTALAGQRYEVRVQTPEQLPADANGLADYRLVVLAGVPVSRLSAGSAEALDRFVRESGGGLIAAGGEEMFDQAVYRDTVLERMLPVSAVEPLESRPAVLALLLVIDRSASMSEDRRMELAKQAARQSVQLLQPYDQAGVMAFSDAPLWVAELAPVADKDQLLRRIQTLTPAGQTNMYQAVQRAFLALAQTAADRRHMILLTDGVPAPGDYREIAQRMAAHNITLSTVSISAGAEQDLLLEMARIAGGRHHHCEDPADVPAILVQETRQASSEDGSQSFAPYVYRSLPGLDAAEAPALAGYALTNPKPQAEQLLLAAGRDPLLAWWRYGKGMTVAWTAGPAGSRAWRDWPGYAAFWKRLVSHAARGTQPSALRLVVGLDGQRGIVRAQIDETLLTERGSASEDTSPLDAASPATVSPEADRLRWTLDAPDGGQQQLVVELAAPGIYEAEFAADRAGEYCLQIAVPVHGEGQSTSYISLFADYPQELELRATDETLLQAVAESTGGRYNPAPGELFAADGRTVPTRTALAPPLILTALLLLLCELAIRRLRF